MDARRSFSFSKKICRLSGVTLTSTPHRSAVIFRKTNGNWCTLNWWYTSLTTFATCNKISFDVKKVSWTFTRQCKPFSSKKKKNLKNRNLVFFIKVNFPYITVKFDGIYSYLGWFTGSTIDVKKLTVSSTSSLTVSTWWYESVKSKNVCQVFFNSKFFKLLCCRSLLCQL